MHPEENKAGNKTFPDKSIRKTSSGVEVEQVDKDYALLSLDMAVKCDNGVDESRSTDTKPKPSATGATIHG
jgi:hypothetical protein